MSVTVYVEGGGDRAELKLGRIRPEELKCRLPHFRRFIETLDERLPKAPPRTTS